MIPSRLFHILFNPNTWYTVVLDQRGLSVAISRRFEPAATTPLIDSPVINTLLAPEGTHFLPSRLWCQTFWYARVREHGQREERSRLRSTHVTLDIVNLPEVSGVSPYASTNRSRDAGVEDRDAAVEMLPCVLRKNCCSAISYRIILFDMDGVR